MKISWSDLLTILGCTVSNSDISSLQPCPFHTHTTPSLTISYTNDVLTFKCDAPGCNFNGDVIELAANYFNIPTAQVPSLFEPNNKLYPALLPTHYNIEYTNSAKNQAVIEDFMTYTHNLLARGTNSLVQEVNDFLLANKYISDLDSIPADLGLMPYLEIPPELKFMTARMHKVEPHILFGLRDGGNIVSFSTLNIRSNYYKSYNVTPSDVAVFTAFSQLSPAEDTIYVVSNELTALAMTTRSKLYQTTPLPVIATAKSALPATFQQVKKVFVLNGPSFKFPLHHIIELYNQESIIINGHSPAVYVHNARADNINIPLYEYLNSVTRTASPIVNWLALRLIADYSAGLASDVYNVFSQFKLSEDKLNKLSSVLRSKHAPEKLITAISANNAKSAVTLYLSNGNMIKKSKAGLIGTTTFNNSELLSNVVMDIHRKYMTNDKNILCDCTLTVDKYQVNTFIPNDEFSSPTRLHAAMTKAFINNGVSPRIAVYKHKNFMWPEIRDVLTESVKVEKEIDTLGITSDHTIDFPKCRISSQVTKQRHVSTFSKNIMQMYGGISASTGEKDIEIFTKLWKSKNDIQLSFALALSHLIYCIYSGVNLLSGNDVQPVHLVFAWDKDNALDTLFNQFIFFTSGCNGVDTLLGGKARAKLHAMQELGSLPFIGLIPKHQTTQALNILSDSPRSIVTLIHSSICNRFNKIANISYLVNQHNVALQEESLIALQAGFPYLLRRLLNEPININNVIIDTLPAIPMFKQIAKYLKVAVDTRALARLITPMLTGYFESADQLLFEAIKELIGEERITVQYTSLPAKAKNKNIIYVGKEHVYIPNGIVDVINALTGRNYYASALDFQLRTSGIITGDVGNFWVFSRNTWNSKINNTLVSKNFNNVKLLAIG